MKLETHSQNVHDALVAYIGDTLSPSERAEFDRRLLEDESFPQQIDEAEIALIEEYADGTLPAGERALVGAWIGGSPWRRGQTAITAALLESAAHPVAKIVQIPKRIFRPVWLSGFAVAASIALVFTVFILQRRPSPPPVIAELSHSPLAEKPQPAGEDTILLQARRLRGSGVDTATSLTYTLHPGREARIQIVVPRASASAVYSIDLQRDAPGEPRATVHRTGLKVSQTNAQPYVAFSLPAGSLPPGSYTGDLHSAQGSYRLHFAIADKGQ